VLKAILAPHHRPGGAALAERARAHSRRGLRLPAVTAIRPLPFARGIILNEGQLCGSPRVGGTGGDHGGGSGGVAPRYGRRPLDRTGRALRAPQNYLPQNLLTTRVSAQSTSDFCPYFTGIGFNPVS